MKFPLEDVHPHTCTLYFVHSFAHTRPNLSFFIFSTLRTGLVYTDCPKNNDSTRNSHRKLKHKIKSWELTCWRIAETIYICFRGRRGSGWNVGRNIWLKYVCFYQYALANVKIGSPRRRRHCLTKTTVRCHIISDSVSLNNPQNYNLNVGRNSELCSFITF
jgi:hypothetical protein